MWCSTIRMVTPSLLIANNQFSKLSRLLRVEASRRLVEQQQLRFRCKRACELHATLQPVGKTPSRRLRQLAKTKGVENCGCTCVRCRLLPASLW